MTLNCEAYYLIGHTQKNRMLLFCFVFDIIFGDGATVFSQWGAECQAHCNV